MSIPDDALQTLPELDASAIEQQIRDGDLLLCSGHHAFSHLIRWATKSPWSHVAMAMRADPIGRVMVLESIEKIGVRTVPFQTFVFGEEGLRPYPGKIVLARHAKIAAAARGDIHKIAGFAVDQLGDPFDPGEVLKIAARVALGSLQQKMPKAMKSRGEYICSEYVAACFEQIGVRPPWDGRGFIAPCDFAADPDVSAIAQVRMPTRTQARAEAQRKRK
jgi:hypothetical protein